MVVVHHFLEVAYPYAHTVDPNEGPVEGGLGDELAACPSNTRAMKKILVG